LANTIIMVRHGQTDANLKGITQGQTLDYRLNETGREEARLLGQFLKNNYPIPDIIYTSTLLRAIETGTIIEYEIFGAHRRNLFFAENGLKEINYGDLEGKYSEELKTHFADVTHIWHSTPHRAKFPNGETAKAAKKRVLRVWNEIIKRNRKRNIYIIGHGRTNRFIIEQVGKHKITQTVEQQNACLNVFSQNGNKLKIELVGYTGHLSALGQKL
jgi:broad specificity phosphatase PhoE